ncbi:MAG: hypothetical protein JO323_00935 [Acidobacteriia bacterium]|nr:hypothetical protein [Terriglobia bacterium]
MLPEFLIPETTVREAGSGPEMSLEEKQGMVFTVTLGITRIIEQQSLEVSIWGSPDGNDWGSRPLASFPQKFYCGTYQIELDLGDHPDVKYLKAKWQVSRWGRRDPRPRFTIYLFLEAAKPAVLVAGV